MIGLCWIRWNGPSKEKKRGKYLKKKTSEVKAMAHEQPAENVPILRIQKLAGVAPGDYYCVVNFGLEQHSTRVRCELLVGVLKTIGLLKFTLLNL